MISLNIKNYYFLIRLNFVIGFRIIVGFRYGLTNIDPIRFIFIKPYLNLTDNSKSDNKIRFDKKIIFFIFNSIKFILSIILISEFSNFLNLVRIILNLLILYILLN